ncbi:TRAP transporter small permease [Pseudoroseomonas globiformis]|uniref:TRAP transporter small permease protein n=1 Tax=Teichococcus globiformis TaxID=2307229 RepID=A0ABV7FZP7_9PROT
MTRKVIADDATAAIVAASSSPTVSPELIGAQETVRHTGLFGRLADLYAALLRLLLGISVLILLLPVTLQIFSRYTPLVPHYIWTEEMARFALVWMVMLGGILAVREGTHFIVDVFPRLSPRGTAIMELVSGVFVLIFALVFLIWGWEFTEFAFYRISEMAELPLWTIHVAWPIAGLSWLIFMGQRMADAINLLRGRTA